jgi:uncharacterized protein (DUF1810 family)
MTKTYNLTRFIVPQAESYNFALADIRLSKKQGHWMWYIFPQVAGLGLSDTSKFYAIKDPGEAEAYLRHPLLGTRLKEITGELLKLSSNDATAIFGVPDNMKLRSSMTLFSELPDADPVFQAVLDKFFGGQKDPRTLDIFRSSEQS